ncbi:MAG: response regulator [Pseudomonadota bacterium]|nr:response regulator [Pseudomonadota bacterium]
MSRANEPPADGAPLSERDETAPGSPAPLRTFIVEDSPVILENLSEALEETSPVSVVGSAGDEGTAVRRLAPPVEIDLVIIDLFLRSGSGLGVLRRLRDAGSTSRRIVLTNYASDEIREKCFALGAEKVFDKSTDLEELIDYCAGLGDGVQAVVHPV